jgi:hypothetical protein
LRTIKRTRTIVVKNNRIRRQHAKLESCTVVVRFVNVPFQNINLVEEKIDFCEKKVAARQRSTALLKYSSNCFSENKLKLHLCMEEAAIPC